MLDQQENADLKLQERYKCYKRLGGEEILCYFSFKNETLPSEVKSNPMHSKGGSHRYLCANMTGLPKSSPSLSQVRKLWRGGNADFCTKLPTDGQSQGRTQSPDSPVTTGIVGRKPGWVLIRLVPTIWDLGAISYCFLHCALPVGLTCPPVSSLIWVTFYEFTLALQPHPTPSSHLHTLQVGLTQLSISSSLSTSLF